MVLGQSGTISILEEEKNSVQSLSLHNSCIDLHLIHYFYLHICEFWQLCDVMNYVWYHFTAKMVEIFVNNLQHHAAEISAA